MLPLSPCSAPLQQNTSYMCADSRPACGACRAGDVNILSSERHGTAEAIPAQIWPLLLRPACMRRCQLYVTCEPCIMCAGALSLLQFERVFVSDPPDFAIEGQRSIRRVC